MSTGPAAHDTAERTSVSPENELAQEREHASAHSEAPVAEDASEHAREQAATQKVREENPLDQQSPLAEHAESHLEGDVERRIAATPLADEHRPAPADDEQHVSIAPTITEHPPESL